MAAAVGTARVTFPMVVVMITPNIGVEVQFACYQCFCCCISVAGNTAKQLNTTFGKCHLGTAPDTAADQNIRIQRMEKFGKRTVSLTVCVDDTTLHYLTVLNIVNLKLLGMSEMLINVAIFVCYCNSHDIFSFIHFVFRLKLPFLA